MSEATRTMFLFHKPSNEEVRQHLERWEDTLFSYIHVGCTRGGELPGFNRDHQRVLLGHGEETFRRACQAIRTWQMLPPSVVQVSPHDAPLTEGTTVAILFHARLFGCWLVLPTRIIYTIDEATSFGFAYGTVQGHWEQGEERFLIEWDHSDDSVWYDVRAFSKPRYWGARVAYPVTRMLQRRFARDSKRAMLRALA